MTTLVLSDLHLGRRDGRDLLRRPAAWEPLLARAARAERVVLLGDVVELRQGPMAQALEAARPFMRALGAAAGPSAEIVLVPGNHDHRLIAGWHERRRAAGPPLGLEQEVRIQRGEAAGLLARWARPATLRVAYPGLWLRADVYATHGHYLDVHTTVPSLERLAVGALARVTGRLAPHPGPADYEAALAPLYAALHELAQRPSGGSPRVPGAARRPRLRPLASLLAAGHGDRPPRLAALRAGYPVAVAALQAAGLGPLRRVARAPELTAAGVVAMAEVCDRLAIPAAHVVFGHLHRAGPLPGADDASAWTTPAGVRLMNTGSWVFEPGLLASDVTPAYWPGTCVVVRSDGIPRVDRVLADGAHGPPRSGDRRRDDQERRPLAA